VERKKKERNENVRKKMERKKKFFFRPIITHSCKERRNRHKLKCIIAVST
jgi:DNA-binding TFAR19-related protein (PDSD5 family)